MRWLFRLFAGLFSLFWFVPRSLWRGFTGWTPPDPVQAARRAEALDDGADLDADYEAMMAEAADHQAAMAAARTAALTAVDPDEPFFLQTPEPASVIQPEPEGEEPSDEVVQEWVASLCY